MNESNKKNVKKRKFEENENAYQKILWNKRRRVNRYADLYVK